QFNGPEFADFSCVFLSVGRSYGGRYARGNVVGNMRVGWKTLQCKIKYKSVDLIYYFQIKELSIYCKVMIDVN
ncbi:hypothetical protein ACQP3J_27010, partial [Escherichia coli]